MVDDYREAYWWLRDNTPQDARVMAWWDYGYQIAGIANRTTIADGNTCRRPRITRTHTDTHTHTHALSLSLSLSLSHTHT